MSKSRWIASLIVIAAFIIWTHHLAAGWWPLQSAPRVVSSPSLEPMPNPVPSPAQKAQREPIRVGESVQASKIIYMVEPVFPEEAKLARIQGIVVLQALIDGAGIVQELKVLRGHPMLREAAVEAVERWRYSSTLLNGEPVPVIASISVLMQPGRIVILDPEGNVKDPNSALEGETLVQDLLGEVEPVIVRPEGTPFKLIEAALKKLQAMGLQDLRLRSNLEFHKDQLFYPWPYSGIEKPEIVLQEEALKELALASGLMEEIRPEKDGSKLLLYTLYLNEVSEIVDVVRLRGPDIPDVVDELFHTPVITPGRLGMEPIPVFFHVEVRVK